VAAKRRASSNKASYPYSPFDPVGRQKGTRDGGHGCLEVIPIILKYLTLI
jgi:hypothetical protein